MRWWAGSSLSDHFGRLRARTLRAGLPDGADPRAGVRGRRVLGPPSRGYGEPHRQGIIIPYAPVGTEPGRRDADMSEEIRAPLVGRICGTTSGAPAVAVPGAEPVQGEDGHVPVESQGLPYRVVPTAKAQPAAGPDAPASSPSPATSPTSATTAPPSSAVNTAACSAHRQDATQPGSATPEQHRGFACLFSASMAIRTKLFLGRPPIGWGTAWAA